jgi:hypothetical protein
VGVSLCEEKLWEMKTIDVFCRKDLPYKNINEGENANIKLYE